MFSLRPIRGVGEAAGASSSFTLDVVWQPAGLWTLLMPVSEVVDGMTVDMA